MGRGSRRHVEDAGGAEGAEGGVGRPEGAEDCGGGGGDSFCGGDFVVYFVDESVFPVRLEFMQWELGMGKE